MIGERMNDKTLVLNDKTLKSIVKETKEMIETNSWKKNVASDASSTIP